MKKKHNIPKFETLEDRLLMSSSLLTALSGSAQTVTVEPTASVAVSGTINEQPYDVYQFVAPAQGRLVVDMIAADGSIDPYLNIYNSRGQRLARNNNASSATKNSHVSLRVQAGKTYYVMADSLRSTRGSYQLSWANRPTDDFGNTKDASRALRVNRAGNGSVAGTINYSTDVDLFRFVADRDGQMTVTLSLQRGSGLQPSLTVGSDTVDSLGTGTGPSASVVVNVQQGKVYYIRAGGENGSGGRYRVGLAVQKSVAPAVTGGDAVPTEIPAAQAAARVMGQVLNTSAGLQLLVLGTNGNDTLTISQTATGLSLNSWGMQDFDGDFASIVVYGFDGNDTIRIASGIRAGVWTDAGSGNDQIFVATTGQSVILAGEGDDLMVTIGAGAATLSGQGGLDSFWVNSGDRLLDTSAEETSLAAVHRVTQFYQPAKLRVSVPLTIAGQALPDPTIGVYGGSYRNFANSPLFVDGAEYTDVQQGGAGDCYYMASLAAIAQENPQRIRQIITPLGDGTYAVRFFRNGQSVYVRVDADLPVYGASSLIYAGGGEDGETWVPLMEKAYAFFRYSQDSYDSLDGGWMEDVFMDVLNVGSTSRATSGSAASLADFFQSNFNQGKAITLGSNWYASGPIIGSHAYTVQNVVTNSQGTFVTVYNPWGEDGVRYDSNYGDGLLTLSIAQMQQYFFEAVVTQV